MESNKLIAEFMDLSTEIDGLYLLPNGLCEEEMMGFGSIIYINEMLYHKSWSWLIPVVETCFHNGADENHIGDLTHALLECNLEYTYEAVVDFIKYYNKQQHES